MLSQTQAYFALFEKHESVLKVSKESNVKFVTVCAIDCFIAQTVIVDMWYVIVISDILSEIF